MIADWLTKDPELGVDLGADMVEVWAAIEQLQDAVDALSRPLPAAPDEEVTEAMALAGLAAMLEHRNESGVEQMKAAYRAVRAAAAPTQEPEPEQDAKHEGGMATPHTCAYCDYYSGRVPGCSGRCEKFEGDADAFDTCSHWQAPSAPTPKPSVQPSEELRLLRARCERLAAVACRAIALRIPAWLEPQMAGVELEGARVCRLRDALLALHPGDTEAG